MNNFSVTPLPSFNSQHFVDARSANVRSTLGISACLVGERVRYDGAEKSFAGVELLDTALTLIPICPEVGAGLAVPRPPVQLITTDTGLHAQGRDDATLDVTVALQHYAKMSADHFSQRILLCGYLLKSRSPSCGLGSTPIFNTTGQQIGFGNGIQADYFQRHFPWVHYGEESDLDGTQAIALFVLMCRLVFDLLQIKPNDLPQAHRHYHFLSRRMVMESREQLNELSELNNTLKYLAAFKVGCSQINPQEMLNLFCA
ncbi:MAG: hypothetical protein JWM78_2414 [Verrucomicrobiaceae bacterium]|nr:hypothetical protein [Verrucomicrobiaceae bacterium]